MTRPNQRFPRAGAARAGAEGAGGLAGRRSRCAGGRRTGPGLADQRGAKRPHSRARGPRGGLRRITGSGHRKRDAALIAASRFRKRMATRVAALRHLAVAVAPRPRDTSPGTMRSKALGQRRHVLLSMPRRHQVKLEPMLMTWHARRDPALRREAAAGPAGRMPQGMLLRRWGAVRIGRATSATSATGGRPPAPTSQVLQLITVVAPDPAARYRLAFLCTIQVALGSARRSGDVANYPAGNGWAQTPRTQPRSQRCAGSPSDRGCQSRDTVNGAMGSGSAKLCMPAYRTPVCHS